MKPPAYCSPVPAASQAVEVGSGNVFADLGFPDATELDIKVPLPSLRIAIPQYPTPSSSTGRCPKSVPVRQPHIDLEPEEVRILQALAGAHDDGNEEVPAQ